MAHGDAIGHRDGAEFARRAARRSNAFLHRLGLAHKRDVAGAASFQQEATPISGW